MTFYFAANLLYDFQTYDLHRKVLALFIVVTHKSKSTTQSAFAISILLSLGIQDCCKMMLAFQSSSL